MYTNVNTISTNRGLELVCIREYLIRRTIPADELIASGRAEISRATRASRNAQPRFEQQVSRCKPHATVASSKWSLCTCVLVSLGTCFLITRSTRLIDKLYGEEAIDPWQRRIDMTTTASRRRISSEFRESAANMQSDASSGYTRRYFQMLDV